MGCARRAKSVHKLQPVSMGIAVVVAFAPRHVDDLAPPDRRHDLPPPVSVGVLHDGMHEPGEPKRRQHTEEGLAGLGIRSLLR